jgi:alpha-glucosidase
MPWGGHPFGLAAREGDGLLADDMDPRAGRPDHVVAMQIVRQRYVDRVQLAAPQIFVVLVVAERGLHAVPPLEGAQLAPVDFRTSSPILRAEHDRLSAPPSAWPPSSRSPPQLGVPMLTAHWWQRGVIYQIYPRSFMDADGDGVGDLEGIRSRLDYLTWLGIDAIWISPIYPSPMTDFGYDISDYCAVDARFGTLATFDALVAEAHRLGIKVVLDYVPNHTSDQHPWFEEARRSRQSPRRDYYLWRDPGPGGQPPNNWLSEFGGPAWQWEPETGQFYYHAYLKTQPDLNWRHPEVRAAMLNVLRFWLERGVDGFRVDTIHHLIKDQRYRDNPPNPHYRPGDPPHRALLRLYTTDRPEVHAMIAEMRQVLDGYPDRVLIGEAYLPIERLAAYYGTDLSGLHLPFNFQLITARWQAAVLSELAQRYEASLPPGAWPNWVLGNHDRSRIASRVGPRQARVAAMLLLTLRGTPTLYYGDELGMRDVPIPPAQVQDPWERNVPGLGLGRDPERTPMQWSPAPNAGFSTGRPWLPLAADFAAVNVETESADPSSMLVFYRALLSLRRRHPALSLGAYVPLELPGDVFGYLRRGPDGRLAILLNLSDAPQQVDLASDRLAQLRGAKLLLSTHGGRPGEALSTAVTLDADEGIVVDLV